jgi:predicted DNA-binding transcriptional regulator AlpA
MNDDTDYGLTLQEAAHRVGCSTKTLYRHMTAGTLSFRIGADNRRYLSECELKERFPASTRNTASAALQHLQREVQALAERLHAQELRLEQTLSLFQPRTLKELAIKQAALHPPGNAPPDRRR